MIEIFLYLLALYLAFRFGQVWAFIKMQEMMIKAVLPDTLKEVSSLINRDLTIEYHNDILYLFDNNGNDFICQSDSIDGLAVLAKQYKNISNASVLDTKTQKLYKFVDGKVNED